MPQNAKVASPASRRARAVGRGSGRPQRRLPRLRRDDRVGVDRPSPRRAEILDRVDQGRIVDPEQPLALGDRRLQAFEARPSRFLEHRLDRPDPARVLGMRARVVEQR